MPHDSCKDDLNPCDVVDHAIIDNLSFTTLGMQWVTRAQVAAADTLFVLRTSCRQDLFSSWQYQQFGTLYNDWNQLVGISMLRRWIFRRHE